MIGPAYTYAATVIEIHDGDTITVNVDCGLHNWEHGQKIRLLGLNAPELKQNSKLPDGPGEKSRDTLTAWLAESKMSVVLQTKKDDKEKYGRWLGTIWATDAKGIQYNVNQRLLDSGLAVVLVM